MDSLKCNVRACVPAHLPACLLLYIYCTYRSYFTHETTEELWKEERVVLGHLLRPTQKIPFLASPPTANPITRKIIPFKLKKKETEL